LGEATLLLCAALPLTIQRIAGSWRRRSASFTSSYPARRPNTDCRNNPANACRPFLPLRASAISQQPSIGGHQGAAKLEHQAAVRKETNSNPSLFTPWRHPAHHTVSTGE